MSSVAAKDTQPEMSRDRTTLTSLPKELLTAISLLLPDRASLLSFSLTARSIYPCCERELWRELDISLPVFYGHRPHVHLLEPETHDIGAVDAAMKADEQRRSAMRKMLRAALNAGNGRRWGMVDKLRVEVDGGSVHGIIQLLDHIPSLRQLELEAPPIPDSPGVDVGRLNHETLDFRFISSGLHFPSLSHIRLGRNAIRFGEFLPLLCNSSPSLTSLIVDLTGRIAPQWLGTDVMPHFPKLARPTKIQQLRLKYPDEESSNPAIKSLLQHTPELRQLLLENTGAIGHTEPITPLVLKLPKLQDLSWNKNVVDFWCDVMHWEDLREATEGPFFPELRRLVLKGRRWNDILEELNPMPQLAELYFDFSPSPPMCQAGPTTIPKPTEPKTISPAFSDYLLIDCPSLRLIHSLRDHVHAGDFCIFSRITEIPSSGTAQGLVRSMTHGGDEELVHARFLTCHVEVSDTAIPADADMTPSSTYVPYEADEGFRAKTYEEREEATWQHLTDYNGLVVPLEVISRMEAAEGAGADKWEGRGVEVGAEAWKVLTDWVEAENETKAAEGPG